MIFEKVTTTCCSHWFGATPPTHKTLEVQLKIPRQQQFPGGARRCGGATMVRRVSGQPGLRTARLGACGVPRPKEVLDPGPTHMRTSPRLMRLTSGIWFGVHK